MPQQRSFSAVLDTVRSVDGWMTDAQARLLWEQAAALGSGDRIVEIGSYQGRSTIVLASAAASGVEVIAIDPHAGNDRGPQQITGPAAAGQSDHERFNANLAMAGVTERVRHVRKPSQSAGGEVDGTIDLLYIDGAHRFAPALSDMRAWGGRVAGDGTLLIHDSFSSIGVTFALVASLFFGPNFRYVGRAGSMAHYERATLTPRQRAVNAARQAAQLPWFARNVLIKILIVAKLGRLTRLLGHQQPTWPY